MGPGLVGGVNHHGRGGIAMKCTDCGSSLRVGIGEVGLLLECERCAYPPFDCTCKQRHGYTPPRWVHCIECDRMNITRIDTTQKGWRGMEV